MFRFLFFVAVFIAYLLSACNPPVRVRPARPNTGLDSTLYVGVVEEKLDVDLRKATYLAKIKVGDLGVTLDCRYPDVLGHATARARSLGGNLLVITEHTRNQVKSNCHRIKGEIYAIPSLEGLERRIVWHPARPLLRGDLRGDRDSLLATPLPRRSAVITCRLGGDFFKEAVIRTETFFLTDSAYLPATAADAALRRAQLHFDLAELHARRLKVAIAAIGPDLPALTGNYQALAARQQEQLRAEQTALDAELDANNAEEMFSRWETAIRTGLSELEGYRADYSVDLRKKKK